MEDILLLKQQYQAFVKRWDRCTGILIIILQQVMFTLPAGKTAVSIYMFRNTREGKFRNQGNVRPFHNASREHRVGRVNRVPYLPSLPYVD